MKLWLILTGCYLSLKRLHYILKLKLTRKAGEFSYI